MKRTISLPKRPYTVVATYLNNDQILVTHVDAIDGLKARIAAETWAEEANGWSTEDRPHLCVYAVFPGRLLSEADDFDEVTGEPIAAFLGWKDKRP